MKKSRQYNIWRDWMMLSAIVIFVASLGYFTIVFAKTGAYIPREFMEARAKGAEISENIVRLTSESGSTLKEIGRLDKERDYEAGVNLVQEELKRNDEIRQAALGLAAELEKMAIVVAKIRPDDASDIAVQAIVYESQIVTRLISQHNSLYQLLEFLRSRFTNGEGATGEMVQDLITKMNAEVTAINDLNNQYKEAMLRFDALTTKAL